MGGVGDARSSHGHRSPSILDIHGLRRSELPNLLHREGFDGHLPKLVSIGSIEIGIGVGRDLTFSPELRLVVSHGRPALESMKISGYRLNGLTLSPTWRGLIPWR